MKISPNFKIWLEHQGKPVLGKGGASLLQNVLNYGSLTKSAKESSFSFRYAWNYLKKIEKIVGKPAVETFRGGPGGGGRARLTDLGMALLIQYKRFREFVTFALKNPELWQAVGLRAPDRNRIRGRIVGIDAGRDGVAIRVRADPPFVVSSIITRRSTDELGLGPGDQVQLVIKATEAMIDVPE